MSTTINLRDLDDTLVTEAKVAAAEEGVTLKEYTCRALRERIAAKQRATLPQDKRFKIRDTSTHSQTEEAHPKYREVADPGKRAHVPAGHVVHNRPPKAAKLKSPSYDVGHSPRCQCIACRGMR